ncbi:(Na+)-NQR maturation NqrM [Alysiella filiformis]|uniref:(Na+)-NQR maturation NqrM n=1 Tax=Alysiella filiformis DSM 16848 TaxID=1120981 RepID=A0A286E9R2_9NEIS|nr:(Na+)-NQR maturation NqrM [Alysiella filiformis]QMT31386.1 (Na+)-NQR maturation NqrM [Alysiella filiformis]UBQ55605.1 (Na+)-NQR maturation NqrM [Alysiella filiformis DSM 16848]SOD67631.1 hypothetical protein SAMN02746062_00975 [Alysiella filiformis DSM 16848]
MQTFLITLVFFLAVIFAMALGYIFKRREIKGSCGGIAALGMEKVCDCDTPCAKRRKMLEQQANQS